MSEDSDTDARVEQIVQDVLVLFREQPDYDCIAHWEDELVRRIAYVSAIAQSEKVTPPGGWDPFGR